MSQINWNDNNEYEDYDKIYLQPDDEIYQITYVDNNGRENIIIGNIISRDGDIINVEGQNNINPYININDIIKVRGPKVGNLMKGGKRRRRKSSRRKSRRRKSRKNRRSRKY